MELTIKQKLADVQAKLKAPKSQFNGFGKYNYRNCEDILEAVKPLLLLNGLTLVITDEIVMIGTRYYVKANAEISLGAESLTVSAFARESEVKTGMDVSQITGAASSYARKYALNGLFLIDDTKDADSHEKAEDKPKPIVKPETKPADMSSSYATTIEKALDSKVGTTIDRITGRLKESKQNNTKTGKERTYYTISNDEGVEIIVMEWAKPREDLVSDILVDVLQINVTVYNNEKQFTCKSIGISESEIPFN